MISLELKATMAELHETRLVSSHQTSVIGRDFSDGGAGMKLLADIDQQIDRGNFRALE